MTCTIGIVVVVCRAASCLVLASACSSFSSSDLLIDRVDPASGANTADVAVQIDGTGFHLPISSSLDQATTTVGTMSVALGDTVLSDAARLSDEALSGTVPAGLPVGPYDVTVTIGDRTAVLPGGYTVTAPGATAIDPLHLATADGMSGNSDLTLSGTVTIDTSAPSISVTLPAGDLLDVRPQLGGGPDLAVLHVGGLTIASGAVVTVTGSRPLVIVAGGDVKIDGTLDASAHAKAPGPGGAVTDMGTGAGAQGSHETTSDSDTGGSGGGYGTAGANGGQITGCTVAMATGGKLYGDVSILQLVGGSGGGLASGTACLPVDQGGGGGGALQLSSATKIDISSTGKLDAGGGGGGGATDCGAGDVNSGAGGGSGGSIVLQAPMIANAGVIAANGGGGGGGSQTSDGSAPPGQDGQIGATPAAGGVGPVATGGAGGAGTTLPGP
ncbi:MAG: hypothetical protein ACM31C_13790, partial [Acidobacteriota bacterium]